MLLLKLVFVFVGVISDGHCSLYEVLYTFIGNIIAPPCYQTPSEFNVYDVKFYLSNEMFNSTPILLANNNLNLVNKTQCTKILINGYIGWWNMPGFMDMKDDYIKCKQCQVIHVDWDKYAQQWYGVSVCYARTVGLVLSNFIQTIQLPLELVHCIGLSLGGQACGFFGKEIQRATGQKISRITGLDASGPGFQYTSDSNHLNKNDAIFVDNIHTDSGLLGISQPIATVDYWVNGGYHQPCCPFCSSGLVFRNAPLVGICNHVMSLKYMRQSICDSRIFGFYCYNYKSIPNSCVYGIQAIFGENIVINATVPGNYLVI